MKRFLLSANSSLMRPAFVGCALASLFFNGCATADRAVVTPARSSSAGSLSVNSPDAGAATEISSNATLDDLLLLAAEENAGLRAAFYEWKAAVERIPQARALPDPNLSYAYFLERMETRQTVGLSQMFPWFGTRELRGQIASEVAFAAAARFEAARLKLFEEVKSAYAEYGYIEQALRIVRGSRALLGHFEEVALARFRAGEGSNADVLRIQMELGRLENEIQTTEAMRGPVAAQLNAALGRPAEAPLPEPDAAREAPVVVELPERSASEWLAANPLLRAAAHEIVRDEAEVELAEREGRPDITVGVEVMDNIGMAPDEVMVMASVSLPLWRERYAAARREAEAMRNESVATRENLQRELETAVQMTLFGLRDAERKLRLYDQVLLPRARQSVESLQSAYRVGDADFLDLLEAQRTLLSIELNQQRALADQVQQLAGFERIIGYSVEEIRAGE